MTDGLKYGDVPTSVSTGINAPWLTSDYRSHRQVWSKGSSVDKRRIRLTVAVPEADTRLVKWSTFARQNQIDPKWYQHLNAAGGGGSDWWYLYMGIVSPSWIVDAKDMQTHSAPSSYSLENVEAARALYEQGDIEFKKMIATLTVQEIR